jgi:hypothetical protein
VYIGTAEAQRHEKQWPLSISAIASFAAQEPLTTERRGKVEQNCDCHGEKKKKTKKKPHKKKGKKRYIGTYPSRSREISTNVSFSLTKHTDGSSIKQ